MSRNPQKGRITGAKSIQRMARLNLDPTSAKTDAEALAKIMPEIYEELRRLAASYLRGERSEHTLQRTALVHEAYLRLAEQRHEAAWQNRAHFFAVAAQQLRRILVDHARRRESEKRGGVSVTFSLDQADGAVIYRDDRLLALDEALARLEFLDERAAKVTELRYFGGLSEDEAAQMLGISLRTAKRDWTAARAWLQAQLNRKPV